MFLLKILLNLLDLGKCLSSKLRNVFATLVIKLLVKPFADRYWYVFDDLRRVVGGCVDI